MRTIGTGKFIKHNTGKKMQEIYLSKKIYLFLYLERESWGERAGPEGK